MHLLLLHLRKRTKIKNLVAWHGKRDCPSHILAMDTVSCMGVLFIHPVFIIAAYKLNFRKRFNTEKVYMIPVLLVMRSYR
jgi:hypothetical protein